MTAEAQGVPATSERAAERDAVQWVDFGGNLYTANIPTTLHIDISVGHTPQSPLPQWSFSMSRTYLLVRRDVYLGYAVYEQSDGLPHFGHQFGTPPVTVEQVHAQFPESVALVYTGGRWAVCSPWSPVDYVVGWMTVQPTDEGIDEAAWSTDPTQAYARVRYVSGQSWPAGQYPRTSVSAYMLATAGGSPDEEVPAAVWCYSHYENGGGGGPSLPYEPPYPLEWSDWPSLPDLPDVPGGFTPPSEMAEWEIEHSDPEDLPFGPVEDPLESAITRWKARLGLPDHHTIFGTPAHPTVELDVIEWTFQVGSMSIPVVIDFDEWRPYLSLFGVMLNGAAGVWVLCGIYDALRRA